MKAKKEFLNNLVIVSVLFLAGCGTFEIGIENNTVPENDVKTEEIPVEPVPTTVTEEPTAQPPQSDEAAISAALEGKLGVSIEELPFAISQNTGTHAKGNASNGYFWAVKVGEEWLIDYDGQANPQCSQVDIHNFPIEMVPECLDENNQLVVRSGSGETKIGEALAEYFGVPLEELDYTLIQETGTHAMGYMPNGYFLAAKAGEKWLIAYDGHGTPYCAQVDLHNFPIEMVPECMDASNNLVVRTGSVIPPTTSMQSLDCGAASAGASPGTVDYVACNIQDGLRSRNTSALLGCMEDPFTIGYWQSEGVRYTPSEFINLLPALYNFNDPGYTPRLTFTTDRRKFPALDGMPPEGMFGSDINIALVVYSEGWGLDGQGGSLLFFIQDDAGSYSWYGMGYSATNFSP